MAKRGYSQKGRSFSKSSASRSRSSNKRSASRTKRSGTSRPRAVATQQTIRIVFAQEPGGAALANPALPIPPSVTPVKTRKAQL